jgi:hypothetical protein
MPPPDAGALPRCGSRFSPRRRVWAIVNWTTQPPTTGQQSQSSVAWPSMECSDHATTAPPWVTVNRAQSNFVVSVVRSYSVLGCETCCQLPHDVHRVRPVNDQECESRFSETTFAYVAHWSGGDPDSVRATAERVLACARRIVEHLHLDDDDDDDGAACELVGSDSAA